MVCVGTKGFTLFLNVYSDSETQSACLPRNELSSCTFEVSQPQRDGNHSPSFKTQVRNT
jgi:hypothetical protein